MTVGSKKHKKVVKIVTFLKFVGLDFGNKAIACLNCLMATKWKGCMTLRVMTPALNEDNIKWEFSHI